MPVMHVAALHGLSWRTVRRAEGAALARWDATRPRSPLEMVGLDEKWLGRRHKRDYKYVTIVSNLATGEPIWIGANRREETVRSWLATLTSEQKATIKVIAMDMHRPFANAILGDPEMKHVAIVHDPFHIMKRAGEAVSEVRKNAFFRAGPERRSIGRGARWLVLRAWERSTPTQQGELRFLLAQNKTLARAYQIQEELREALHAPDARQAAEHLGVEPAAIALRTVVLVQLGDLLPQHRLGQREVDGGLGQVPVPLEDLVAEDQVVAERRGHEGGERAVVLVRVVR